MPVPLPASTPELERLFGLAGGGLRAAVLELALPAGWAELAPVWHAVQAELELPAPAIAVSGIDGVQLWFAFASPLPAERRAGFLEALRSRFLADVPARHVRLFADAAGLPPSPGVEVAPQRWSAFVSRDLASIFAETPWLDVPPNDEGQAALLRTLAPIGDEAFAAAMQRLRPSSAVPVAPPAAAPATDPARFLESVMNDAGAPLALRVEAARILLAARGR